MAFLSEPPETEASRRAYEANRESDGYVANLTRVWCWRPDVLHAFAELRALLARDSELGAEDCAVLVAATAAELGDSYCSLAWGARLASLTDETTASEVLHGSPTGLDERGRVLAAWARQLAEAAPANVREAVTYGRAPATGA